MYDAFRVENDLQTCQEQLENRSLRGCHYPHFPEIMIFFRTRHILDTQAELFWKVAKLFSDISLLIPVFINISKQQCFIMSCIYESITHLDGNSFPICFKETKKVPPYWMLIEICNAAQVHYCISELDPWIHSHVTLIPSIFLIPQNHRLFIHSFN